MGRTFPGGIHGAQNLPELSPHYGKPFRGITTNSLPGRFRLCNKCHPCKRTGQGAATSLLLQSSFEGSGREVPKMEKLILALITTSRKLQPYFQGHTVEVSTEYPMKKILHKPETSGRLMKWAIELSEFDIKYKLRTVVKGKILADFII